MRDLENNYNKSVAKIHQMRTGMAALQKGGLKKSKKSKSGKSTKTT